MKCAFLTLIWHWFLDNFKWPNVNRYCLQSKLWKKGNFDECGYLMAFIWWWSVLIQESGFWWALLIEGKGISWALFIWESRFDKWRLFMRISMSVIYFRKRILKSGTIAIAQYLLVLKKVDFDEGCFLKKAKIFDQQSLFRKKFWWIEFT